MNKPYQMISKLNYYWWYIFFTIYWTVKELGTDGLPQSNAKGFLTIFVFLHLFGLHQILLIWGAPINHWIFIVGCYILGIYVTWISFIKKNKYLKRIDQFKPIRYKSKGKRYAIMILTALESIVFMAGAAILRHIYS